MGYYESLLSRIEPSYSATDHPLWCRWGHCENQLAGVSRPWAQDIMTGDDAGEWTVFSLGETPPPGAWVIHISIRAYDGAQVPESPDMVRTDRIRDLVLHEVTHCLDPIKTLTGGTAHREAFSWGLHVLKARARDLERSYPGGSGIFMDCDQAERTGFLPDARNVALTTEGTTDTDTETRRRLAESYFAGMATPDVMQIIDTYGARQSDHPAPLEWGDVLTDLTTGRAFVALGRTWNGLALVTARDNPNTGKVAAVPPQWLQRAGRDASFMLDIEGADKLLLKLHRGLK